MYLFSAEKVKSVSMSLTSLRFLLLKCILLLCLTIYGQAAQKNMTLNYSSLSKEYFKGKKHVLPCSINSNTEVTGCYVSVVPCLIKNYDEDKNVVNYLTQEFMKLE